MVSLFRRILIGLLKVIFSPLYWIVKVLTKHPLTMIYRAVLRTRFRLSALDIHIKNPLTYPLVSKSVGGLVLLVIGIVIFIANVDFATADPDIILPRNLLVSYVSTDLEETFIEAVDQNTPINSGADSSSLSARALPGSSTPVEAPTDTGDIAYNSGSLIKPNIPTEAVGNAPNTSIQTYIVKSGDTLGDIAEKFNISSDTIIWANNLDEKGYLRPGQTLTILPVDGVLYRVKSGDTLQKISNTYDSNVGDVVEQNHLAGADDIHIGEFLILPDGSPPAPIPQQRTFASRLRATVIASSKKPKPASSISSAGSGMIWPTTANIITQYYSWHHTGVDIAGPITNTIFAAASGVVVEAKTSGFNGGYGKTILIDHGNGVQTRYGHASQLFVSPGQKVKKGEAIAMVGSTGRSTGPHLHFEVRVHGTRVNPLGYVHR